MTDVQGRKESLSKCISLPSLQFAADTTADFTCRRCGLTSSFMAVCTWCYDGANGGADDARVSRERVGWNVSSASQQESESSCPAADSGRSPSSLRRDSDASLPQANRHREDNELNPAVAMHKAYTPAHPSASATSLVSGAGSCLPTTPSRLSMSSSSRQLRSRSKSLFSLTQRSSASVTHPEPNATTTESTSTIIMFKAAKALTKRLSSAAMRSVESSSGLAKRQVAMAPEVKDLAADKASDVEGDLDGSKNRSLRRKERIGAPPLAQVAFVSPVDSCPEKRASAQVLDLPPPIAVLDRPPSSESDRSRNMNVKFAPGTRSDSNPSPPTSKLDKGKTINRPHRASMPSAPALHVTKPSIDDGEVEKVPPVPAVPVSILKRSSPTSSLSPKPTPPPRHQTPPSGIPIGHPSRPYYSVIRKHCMSAPAPYQYKPLSPDVRYIPTIKSAAFPSTPSTFPRQNTSVTPFTRRPLSMGAAPAYSGTGFGSHIPATVATNGISVFDIDVEFDSDEDEPPKTRSLGRKANSLSRAFARKTKRRWSSGSHNTPTPPPPSSFFGKGADSPYTYTSPPFFTGAVGISMSGEIELRMSLAAREQEERAIRLERQRLSGIPDPVLQRPPQYSFKPRPVNLPPTQDRQGTPASSASGNGVFARVRKLKNDIMKGFKLG